MNHDILIKEDIKKSLDEILKLNQFLLFFTIAV